MKRKFIIVLFIVVSSCSNLEYDKSNVENSKWIHLAIKNLTDVIVYDIFSPPVASRVYTYPSIAAYEIIRLKDTVNYLSLSSQLKGLNSIPKPQENIDFNIAAIEAIRIIGKKLIFSENRYEKFFEINYDEIHKNIPNKIIRNSKKYAREVSDHIIEWSSKDNYAQTRTFPKYTIINEPDFWKPTPPDYMDGIEPHWNKIRTMVIDSCSQFSAKDPYPFSLDKKSEFYKQLIEVYDITNNLSDEQVEIAKFWDCNPYVSHHKGHAMFATKKITPGGHWINICRIAAEKANSNDIESLRTYSLVSISLFDAFISCWDDKWKTIVVRPETVINEYIDEDWLPLLQTPPFPEYTSGHSVISRSAAIMLTEIYGDNFQFDDTSELEFGLPVRSYKSFIQASEEAAISRLYGGIHYEMAISNGVSQGEKIGEFITNKLTTLKK